MDEEVRERAEGYISKTTHRPIPVRHLMFSRYEGFRNRITIYKRYLYLAAAIVGAGSMLYLWHFRQPGVVASSLADVFKVGYVPAHDSAEDAAAAVARPQLQAQLQAVLRPASSKHYTLVVGAHGTGKSTAVRKAAREAPATGPNGVVYTTVDDVSTFSTQLMTQLGVSRGEMDLSEGMRRKVMEEEAKSTETDPKHEPMASWRPLGAALMEAALEFRKKHGRPMTLVIDNTQKFLQEKPAFLRALQDFAKEAADSGNLHIVFVSSDFAALTFMKARSEWSRCKPMEIGETDVPEAEAVALLATKFGWDAKADAAASKEAQQAAAFIVSHIAGTRFWLLNAVEPHHLTMEAAKAWGQQFHDEVEGKLRAQKLYAGNPLFARMLDAPGQKLRLPELVAAGVSDEQRVALITDVLAAHVDGTFTCSARHVVKTFEALRVAPPTSTAGVQTTASG